jgi:hypothetical protein
MTFEYDVERETEFNSEQEYQDAWTNSSQQSTNQADKSRIGMPTLLRRSSLVSLDLAMLPHGTASAAP